MRALLVTGLAVSVALVSACGPGAPAGPTAPSGTADPSVSTPADELVVVYRDGQGVTSRWTLTCEPVGGTHPRPEAACKALAEHGSEALPAVPAGRQCTQVYGGPQTATVSGTWRGAVVAGRFSRVNGCEIARWDALEGLLPGAGS